MRTFDTLFQRFTAGLSLIALAYLGLVVAPYFWHGLHQQPDILIISGAFDPKGLAPYALAWPIYIVAALAAMLGPLTAGFLTLIALPALLVRWTVWSAHQRTVTVAMWAFAAAVCILSRMPTGTRILVWVMD